MCRLTEPCGGILVQDRPLSRLEAEELATHGIEVVKCLNGHRFYDNPRAAEHLQMKARAGQCLRHQSARPCPGCRREVASANVRRALVPPDVEFCVCGCGQRVPPGRRRYASKACSRKSANARRGGSPHTREELLRQRELQRVGLYRRDSEDGPERYVAAGVVAAP